MLNELELLKNGILSRNPFLPFCKNSDFVSEGILNKLIPRHEFFRKNSAKRIAKRSHFAMQLKSRNPKPDRFIVEDFLNKIQSILHKPALYEVSPFEFCKSLLCKTI
ncbi:MAG: hypothetical protein DRR08_16670 [Candidatus Parabeggiatoa sp. nov. 2]|nr:MAG: hypothetical protein B6247_17225 [Beggiatoa sp. 4572_84]RKZ58347.1 MAG: hypothetical protein DRR08_16670 [Gammaproteobacteria bacterium]